MDAELWLVELWLIEGTQRRRRLGERVVRWFW
jgi:hypothetical protein